jgi:hypothetical protein
MPPADELRRAALLLLDVEALRIWAATYVPDELNTITLADDELVLVSMHEARMLDLTMPDDVRLESLLWLAERGDPVASEAARLMGVTGGEG